MYLDVLPVLFSMPVTCVWIGVIKYGVVDPMGWVARGEALHARIYLLWWWRRKIRVAGATTSGLCFAKHRDMRCIDQAPTERVCVVDAEIELLL